MTDSQKFLPTLLRLKDAATRGPTMQTQAWWGSAEQTELRMFLYDHADAIAELVQAAETTLATLPHMGGNEMSAHNLAMALSEALSKLDAQKEIGG